MRTRRESSTLATRIVVPLCQPEVLGGTLAERLTPELDIEGRKLVMLTPELAQQAQWLVTMGCGDQCPYVPGAKRDDWPLEDPKGQSIERVREIRDQIRDRVQALIEREGWSKPRG